jgi:hypothetical protein
MNNSPYKIAAFTLMDLMTGMVITSIVVGMVLYSFAGLNKQITAYTLTRAEITNYRLMKLDLERQFEASNSQIITLPNGFYAENDSTKIDYVFDGIYFLRKDGFQTDTLTNEVLDWKVQSYENEKGEITPFVSKFQLKILLANQETTCFFSRVSNPMDDFNQQLIDGI